MGRRTFIKLHDGMPHHPAIAGLSDAAFRVLVTAWCDAGANLTDGVIPDSTWQRMAPKRVRDELVAAGRVEPRPADLPSSRTGEWYLHDYLDEQSSREHVETVRATRAEVGRLGGLAKAQRRSSNLLDESVANGQQILPEDRSQKTEQRNAPNGALSARKRATPRKTTAPERIELDDGMREWARINVPGVDLERETAQFLDHHAAKGNTFVDWRRAWMTWMRNAVHYSQPARPANGSTTDARVAAAQSLKRPEVEQ